MISLIIIISYYSHSLTQLVAPRRPGEISTTSRKQQSHFHVRPETSARLPRSVFQRGRFTVLPIVVATGITVNTGYECRRRPDHAFEAAIPVVEEPVEEASCDSSGTALGRCSVGALCTLCCFSGRCGLALSRSLVPTPHGGSRTPAPSAATPHSSSKAHW